MVLNIIPGTINLLAFFITQVLKSTWLLNLFLI